MKEKLLIIIFVVTLTLSLIAIANYINDETIKKIASEENVQSPAKEETSMQSSNSINLTGSDFDEKVLNSDKKVVVDFYADWCGPCAVLSPLLESVISKSEDVILYKVNVDEETDLSLKYNIYYLPTVIVFENGKVINMSYGAISEEKIKELIK